MKRLLLRADASTRMGTGHVMRCLALAQAWQDAGGEACLLSRGLPAALAERMESEGVQLLPPPDVSDDGAETGLAAAGADWTVIDGYHFDADYCERVISRARHVLVIDDQGLLPRYAAEIVLNQNVSAGGIEYRNLEEGATLLRGPAYALLRREFRRPKPAREWDAPCERVLVTFGGSDPCNLSARAIEALLTLPRLRAKVVVGAAYSPAAGLRELCAAAGSRFEWVMQAPDMVRLMDWAQLAVSAGGTSVLELASRGVPTLLLAVADNQRAICETMQSRGVMASLGWHEAVDRGTLASAIASLSSDERQSQRAEFSHRGMALVDGRGALRVVREMLAREAMTAMRLRRAHEGDMRPVFNWANDPVTRSVSFNQSAIPWEEHQAWFRRKLDDPACQLYIGEDSAGTAIGLLRFDLDGHSATISVNIAPEQRRRGLGARLILAGCREILRGGNVNRVRALIKPGNAASLRAFRCATFEAGTEVNVAGQRALQMIFN